MFRIAQNDVIKKIASQFYNENCNLLAKCYANKVHYIYYVPVVSMNKQATVKRITKPEL